MALNVTEFRWSGKSERAALLVADDSATDQDIADKVGISKRQLERWKTDPAFSSRVREHKLAQAAAVTDEGIANKQNRIAILNDLAGRLIRTIEARAADTTIHHIPGGCEGVLVRTAKLVKVYSITTRVGGDDLHPEQEVEEDLYPERRTVLVEEFAVDTGTSAELRATLKQAAQETGQWVEKAAQTDAEGKDLPLSELADRYARARSKEADPKQGTPA